MQIIIHVSKHYDWEPLPTNVQPTAKDIKSLRVKPSANGGWLMRTTKNVATHTSINLPESQIIALIIEGIVRDKVVYNRSEAVSHYLARHVMPGEAHRSWMHDFECFDEGGDPMLFAQLLEPHFEVGNISEEDRDELTKAYDKPLVNSHHVDHLHKHFGVEKKNKKNKESV